MEKERIVFLDWLRAIACLMVFIVHASEAYYSNDYQFHFDSGTARWSVLVFQSLVRSSVPLFLMASAYLLVPVRTSTRAFFKRRFMRVVVPLLVFLALYAVLPTVWGAQTWSQAWVELRHAYINFPVAGSHLWFIYMLIGIYLIMPVISPWLDKVGKKEERVFLLIWLFTSTFYRLRPMLGGAIFGECWWGVNATFYYVSGFVGYVILAHYIRTYVHWDRRRILAVCGPLFVVTFGILFASGAYYSTRSTTPEELEQDWQFLSIVPAFMSFAAFMLISTITSSGKFYNKVVLKISASSYGMYLMHMLILPHYFKLFSQLMPEYLGIPAIALATYVTSFVIAYLIGKLPFGKYIVG